jgi:transposase-like protein
VIARSGDAEVLREPIRDAARRLLAIEVSAVCGAGHGKRTPERESQRNGYRARQWGEEDGGVRRIGKPSGGRFHRRTAGATGLTIPKLRKGGHFPSGPSIDPPDRSMPSAPGAPSPSRAGRPRRR